MLVATCDFSSKIFVYRLRINWNKPNEEALSQGAQLRPCLVSTPLASILLDSPPTDLYEGVRLPLQITHMLLLPSAEPPLSEQSLRPELIVIATGADAASDVLLYKLTGEQEKLHPAFETITGASSTTDTGLVSLFKLHVRHD